jgi:hypothetical protein
VDSLNNHVREYTIQLSKGHIQKAYRGIMTFMSSLNAYFEGKYPDYTASALYFGYMDMTYFAFTPSALKNMRLKIAIVFLHVECKFEVWLAGNNRRVRTECITLLSHKNIGRYTLTPVRSSVDSIIASLIVAEPDFDNPDELKKQIEVKTIEFIRDMTSILG